MRLAGVDSRSTGEVSHGLPVWTRYGYNNEGY